MRSPWASEIEMRLSSGSVVSLERGRIALLSELVIGRLPELACENTHQGTCYI